MTFDEWANRYAGGMLREKDDAAMVALLAAADSWRTALHLAAKECAALQNCEENTEGYRSGAGWCKERILALSNAGLDDTARPNPTAPR